MTSSDVQKRARSGTPAPSCGKEPIEVVREVRSYSGSMQLGGHPGGEAKHAGGIIFISLMWEHLRIHKLEHLAAEWDVDGWMIGRPRQHTKCPSV